MSWNAAKRILTYGYSNVAWYPEGTDGWERAGLALAESQPEAAERARRLLDCAALVRRRTYCYSISC